MRGGFFVPGRRDMLPVRHGPVHQVHHHDIDDDAFRDRGGLAMTGRPPCYTPALAQRVLDEVSAGRPLREVCGDGGIPAEMTVRKWIQDDVDGFAARYRQARQAALSVVPGQVRYTRAVADAVTEALTRGQPLADI